jgi:hypothetical protein
MDKPDLRITEKPAAPIGPSFVSHHSHGAGTHVEGHAVLGNIARDGAPKRHTDVMVNPGMVAKSRKTGLLHTHAHSIDYTDSDPGNPLKAGPPRGKDLRPVPIKPGMRSRTSPGLTNDVHFALGKIAMDNATKSGGTPAHELGIGKLNPTVEEN